MPDNFELVITLAALALFAALGIWMIILERNPPPPGTVRLVPTTSVLFICMLLIVVTLAHLISLVTGAPHLGRLG